jgi:hypothetical protein
VCSTVPDPVGAPSSTFSSVWYKVWKAWVWIGLKCVNRPWYKASYSGFRSADSGSGSRSSSSAKTWACVNG